jgi:HEAT repeat protein
VNAHFWIGEAGLDPVIVPAAVAALGELIAEGIAASAGATWKSLKGKPEARAVRAAIDAAVLTALRNAALPAAEAFDDMWLVEVAKIWRPAFTRQVSVEMLACVTDPLRDRARLVHLATSALQQDGCDLAEFGRTFWVEEFLAVLPRTLLECLSAESLQDDRVRGLVDHLLRQRVDARERAVEVATPREFRKDLTALLRKLDQEARTGRLPSYLPPDADVTALSRQVRVRPGVRVGVTDPPAAGVRAGQAEGGAYRLPAERRADSERPRPWPEVAAGHPFLVVLGDPGLGKSWLIRTETHRLAQDALANLDADSVGVIVPVPARCDQLAVAAGQDLADKAAAHLTARGLLPERSRVSLAAKVRAGEVVLLLDALDELPAAETGPLRELVRSWAVKAGDHARCVLTSRIAGYTGSPLPGACEVELQAYTPGDVMAVIAAWNLPTAAARQLRDRAWDPAIAGMARIPLLLALLCSLTAQLPAGEALPKTRGQLYDRVMRWFLTGAHRSPDNPLAPARDSVDVDALLEILAPLAFIFATQHEGWTDLMPADRVLNAIRAVGPAFIERGRPAADILRELSAGAGVLVPDSDPSAGRGANYLFLHRTVAEYLVARHLATLPEEDRLAIIDQHRWFDPDWAEVIPMLGERLSRADAAALVGHLLTDENDPFYHSLEIAIRILGARPDADHQQLAGPVAGLAGQAEYLIRHKVTCQAMASQLAAMTYLPKTFATKLANLLADHDADVRRAAVDALAGREDPAVTTALVGRLADDHGDVRRAAVDALAGRQDPAVTTALLERLASGDHGDVRRAAVDALAGRQDPAVTTALLERLASGDHGDVRCAAVDALAGRQDPAVTAALLERLADDHANVRRAATVALAGRQGSAVTAALLERLASGDTRVRRAAADALAGRQGSAVTAALLERLASGDARVRCGACRALAGREDPAVITALLDSLTYDHRYVRQAAVDALAGRQDPAVTTALLERLAGGDHADVRRAAVDALAGRKGPVVTTALLERLADHEGEVRRAAGRALAGREDPAVTTALLERLAGGDHADVRRAAVDALAGREDPAVTAVLLERFADDDVQVRFAAGRALAGRTGPAVTAALLERLADHHPHVRRAAVDALAGREGSAVTAVLLERLADHGDVRRAAVVALAGREDPAITAALLERLAHHHGDVRRAAVDALARRAATQDLVTLAEETRRLDQAALMQVFSAAERLMTRHYRRIEPTARPAIRGAMAWLTVTALTDSST